MKKASLRSVRDTCRHMIGRHARGIVTSGFVFNEEASLQMANATCHYATGRCFRGVVSSDFWRFFEGFCGVFILSSRGFCLVSQNENFLASV